jgi:hypothetical protein
MTLRLATMRSGAANVPAASEGFVAATLMS